MTLEIIVWSLFIGIVLGAFSAIYQKVVLGSFVRDLLKSGASSPDNAKSLKEASCAKNIFVRFALRNSSTYKKIIHSTYSAEKANIDNIKYFIPQEVSFRADSLYSNKGTNLFGGLLTILVFFVVACISLIVIPDLIAMLNNFLSSLK